ncbi:hypothetical protein BX261_0314 [Streptomyces sp. 2321.6]|nr:hypothetical protein BX261_0314 [Streptomyces sp. 2321.6]
MPTPADYLALAHAEKDSVVLQPLTQCPYPFVWQALAANPHTPPVALQELSTARDSVWNDNRLLCLLAEHPAPQAFRERHRAHRGRHPRAHP